MVLVWLVNLILNALESRKSSMFSMSLVLRLFAMANENIDDEKMDNFTFSSWKSKHTFPEIDFCTESFFIFILQEEHLRNNESSFGMITFALQLLQLKVSCKNAWVIIPFFSFSSESSVPSTQLGMSSPSS